MGSVYFIYLRKMSRPIFCLYGDSITQHAFELNGWASLLANEYSCKVDILNRGFSGYNSRWARMIAPEIFGEELTSNSLSLVTVFFGANDAVRKEFGEKQFVPVEEYEKNIESIIKTAQEYTNYDGSLTKVILISPPPVDQEAWRKRCEEKYADDKSIVVPPESNRGNDVLLPYVEALRRVAARCEAPLVDLFAEMPKAANIITLEKEAGSEAAPKRRKVEESGDGAACYRRYLSDGLHLSELGNLFVFRHLMKAIRSNYERFLAPEAFGNQFPHHAEIDFKDPEKTLKSTVIGSWLK